METSTSARHVKSQRHRHLEYQHFAHFIVGQRQQSRIRFVGGVDGDLPIGKSRRQQFFFRLFHTVRLGIDLHQQQRHKIDIHPLQFRF